MLKKERRSHLSKWTKTHDASKRKKRTACVLRMGRKKTLSYTYVMARARENFGKKYRQECANCNVTLFILVY